MLAKMILGLLRGGGHLHGYGLWKAYSQRSGRMIQNGKFYAALKDLAKCGFIRAVATGRDDPRRAPYEITPAGRAAFDRWVIAFNNTAAPIEDEISARALFVFDLPPEVAEPFFLAADDEISGHWKRTEHERDRMLSRPGVADRERLVQGLLLTRALGRTSADLTWLREARAAYKQLPATAHAAAAPPSPPLRGRSPARAR